MDSSLLNDKKESLISEVKPVYEQLIVHPEDGESFLFNDSMVDIYNDMNQIDALLINQAYFLSGLLTTTTNRLNAVDLSIKSEQERLQDMKMLCNKYTDFDNVIPINENTKCHGSFTVLDGSFLCRIKSQLKVTSNVTDVVGNGIEGNKYVYKDGAYVSDSVDTSIRKNLTDSSIKNYHEYERITCSSTEQYILSDFNTDSEPARCTYFIKMNSDTNLLQIHSDDQTVHVVGLQYSRDGVDYIPLEIPDIYMNNKLYCYDHNDYISGDNKISFPTSRYLKLTLQSVGTTDDVLAYDRVMFSHEDVNKTHDEEGNLILVHPDTPRAEYNDLIDATMVVNSAKRHNIKINDFALYRNSYDSESYFTTSNLITSGKFYSAAIFANIYLPEGAKEKDVTFTLNINGIDYKATPINIEGEHKRVFRYSQGKSKAQYTQQLNEPIKNLYLTVRMKGKENMTPFISNVKILLGGEL